VLLQQIECLLSILMVHVYECTVIMIAQILKPTYDHYRDVIIIGMNVDLMMTLDPSADVANDFRVTNSSCWH
jgi:hypothetical protein